MKRILKSWRYWRTDITADVRSPSNSLNSENEASKNNTYRHKNNRDYYGYYMLEVSITNLTSPIKVKLTFDNAECVSKSTSIVLRIKKVGCTKRICYFSDIVSLTDCHISVETDEVTEPVEVVLKKVTKRFAIKRMEKKLTVKHNRQITLAQLGDVDFYPSYDQLFNEPVHSGGSYSNWINQCESSLWTPFSENLTPSFSIVIPTYNAKAQWFNTCIESVLAQTHANWQLIIVDDASTELESQACLNAWESKFNSDKNARVKIIHRDENGHIAAATNTGLLHCTGDYVILLDHDDTLAPQALFELAVTIEQHNNKGKKARVIYSDEDLMSEAGERITPHFKSGWNPDLLRSHNYITHLCCYQRSLLNELGGMRLGVDGAQDYDLILRASLKVSAEQVVHIPKVLYHWRMVEGSTALSSGAKSYTVAAGLKALTDHMAEVNPQAKVECDNRDNFYKVTWPLLGNKSPENKVLPKVSIIIPTRDGLEFLKPCLESLLTITDYANFEVLIVDNGSTDTETLSYLTSVINDNRVKILLDNSPFNYSRINNNAVKQCDGEVICLLNNDTLIIDDNWLTEMVSLAIRPNVGCVGAKLLYPDNTIQHAGVILGLGGYAAHAHRGLGRDDPGYFCRAQLRQNLTAVTGACLVVRREVFEQVSGLTTEFEVAYNDVDFCLKVQAAGYLNVYTPYAELYHLESKTRGEDTCKAKQKRFDSEKARLVNLWADIINNDPYYNPNLTRSREDFSIGP